MLSLFAIAIGARRSNQEPFFASPVAGTTRPPSAATFDRDTVWALDAAYRENRVTAKKKYLGTRWVIRAKVIGIYEPDAVHIAISDHSVRPTAFGHIHLSGRQIEQIKTGGTYRFEATLNSYKPQDYLFDAENGSAKAEFRDGRLLGD